MQILVAVNEHEHKLAQPYPVSLQDKIATNPEAGQINRIYD